MTIQHCDGAKYLNVESSTAIERSQELYIAETTVQLPCFFPSVSSVKTSLSPVSYADFLTVTGHPLFLASAYDLAHCPDDQRPGMETALNRRIDSGAVVLIDSGNYESYWKQDSDWGPADFHKVVQSYQHDLCFCFDNLMPPDSPKLISDDVVAGVTRDQENAQTTVLPIVHGNAEALPDAARLTAEKLYPLLLAVAERDLGEGILDRVRTVRRIRVALNALGFYCPLHLLGTGNPISIIAYTLAGADSFDGLEWCQAVVDHENGRLLHFQQWDLIRNQTEWGQSPVLPYVQSVLMHNLVFYREFMVGFQEALYTGRVESFVQKYVTKEQLDLLLPAIEGVQ